MIKAVGLLSGGLDSTLAVKLILDQKIDVTVLNFYSPFCTCTRKGCRHEAKKVSEFFDIPIKIIPAGKEYIQMIKNPKHGYGSNMNPCIDCRIFMFKKAKKYMQEIGAKFIFTGEVLGQRPMSQHKKASEIIEREAGLENLVVRPLSSKLLKPTIPEEKQWINREELLNIQGRRRLPQMELADEFGIKDYPCPAGGCRLTDPQFSKRIKESFENGEDTIRNINLLKYGRNKKDVLIEVKNHGSPVVLLKKHKDENDIKKAAEICFRYSDADDINEADIRIEKGYYLVK